MVASALILTGPPGAGKSTVGDLLARQSPTPAVHIHSDDFYDRFIKSGFVKPWLEEAQAQNVAVTRALAAAAFAYAAGGYWTIVDGIVGPWFLALYREAAKASGIALDYVVLRPGDAATNIGRVQGRDEMGMKDEKVIRELFAQFSDLGPLEAHVVDSGLGPPQAVADAVRAGLVQGRFRLDAH
jgi:adenylate kinase family enzyme